MLKTFLFQSPADESNGIPVGNKIRELCPVQILKGRDAVEGTVNGTKGNALKLMNTEGAIASSSSSSTQASSDDEPIASGSSVDDFESADKDIKEEGNVVGKHEDLPKTGKKSKKIKGMFKKCVKY